MIQMVRKIYNRILKEDIKNSIRNRFKRTFLLIDKRIIYREYVKACKYILKQEIFAYSGAPYGYRYAEFLAKIRTKYIKTRIMHERIEIRDSEMQKCIDFVRENEPDVYCGSLKDITIYSEQDIGYDEKNKLYYGMYEGKRLYFNSIINTEKEALQYLNGIAAEQSEHSPHRYLTEDFNVGREDIVFDIGCAEGNFALSVVDRVKEIYLFEVEDVWIRPLQLTFAPYRDKVHIIKKCVARKTDAFAVTVDDFCKEQHIKQVGMIKIDVEGYERDVLLGAMHMIGKGRIDKIAICTYHKVKDEEILGKLLSNYKKTMSEGYMLLALAYDTISKIKPPYFTKGIMRAVLDKGKIHET